MKPETVIEIKTTIESVQENYPIIEADGPEPPKWRSPDRQCFRIR